LAGYINQNQKQLELQTTAYGAEEQPRKDGIPSVSPTERGRSREKLAPHQAITVLKIAHLEAFSVSCPFVPPAHFLKVFVFPSVSREQIFASKPVTKFII
jgi:hypothetical protein